MVLSVLQMVLPVLIMVGLGYLCSRKKLFSAQGLEGLRAVVGNITLPVVLFTAFFTADYSGKMALMFAVVFGSCCLGLATGFALRRFVKPYGKFLPFLVTNFEGGMMGYALFGLLYAGQTPIFAMADIGQTLCAFTVYLATLRSVSGEKSPPRMLLKNLFTSPALIGVLSGVALGLAGAHRWLQTTALGPLVSDVLGFVAAPTAGLILLIVGYELRMKRTLIVPVLKTIGLRILVMGALLALSAGVVFSLIPMEKPLLVALMLAYSLPAPFIIPLYADVSGHGEYISTTLSMQTLLSIGLFAGIAVYALM